MSRSTKRNLDGTRAQRQLGSASCPNGRAKCGVCAMEHNRHFNPTRGRPHREAASREDLCTQAYETEFFSDYDLDMDFDDEEDAREVLGARGNAHLRWGSQPLTHPLLQEPLP